MPKISSGLVLVLFLVKKARKIGTYELYMRKVRDLMNKKNGIFVLLERVSMKIGRDLVEIK